MLSSTLVMFLTRSFKCPCSHGQINQMFSLWFEPLCLGQAFLTPNASPGIFPSGTFLVSFWFSNSLTHYFGSRYEVGGLSSLFPQNISQLHFIK